VCDRNYYVASGKTCELCIIGGEDKMQEAQIFYTTAGSVMLVFSAFMIWTYLRNPFASTEGAKRGAQAPRFPISAEKFKIFLVFLQIFSTFESAQIVQWPTDLKRYMAFFSLANIDLLNLVAFDCVMRVQYYTKFCVKIALPMVALITIIWVRWLVGVVARGSVSALKKRCTFCGEPMPFELVDYDGDGLPVQQHTQHELCQRSVRKGKQPIVRDQEAILQNNLLIFKQRVWHRLNLSVLKNKLTKLVFWVLLVSYMPSSNTVLTFFRCAEIGDRYFFTEDYAIECYSGTWLMFIPVALFGIFAYVIGVPGSFVWAINKARGENVYSILEQVKAEQVGKEGILRMKLLNEAKADVKLDGKRWERPKDVFDEERRLIRYLQARNMRKFRNREQLGFLYKYYHSDLWWYEANELTRRLSVSIVLFFFQPGTSVQIIFALMVCVGYLAQVTYLEPYRGQRNNEFACLAQGQLCVTLVCGCLITLKVAVVGLEWDPSNEDLVAKEGEFISWVVIATNIFTLSYGLWALVVEGVTAKRRWLEERERNRKHFQMFRAATRKYADKQKINLAAAQLKKGKKRKKTSRRARDAEADRRRAEEEKILRKLEEEVEKKKKAKEKEKAKKERDKQRKKDKKRRKKRGLDSGSDDSESESESESESGSDSGGDDQGLLRKPPTLLDASWVKPLTNEQEELLMHICNDIDEDGMGTYDRRKLVQIARALSESMYREELEKIFEVLDTTQAGMIEFDALINWWKNRKPGEEDELVDELDGVTKEDSDSGGDSDGDYDYDDYDDYGY
jgi:hypothetical protein